LDNKLKALMKELGEAINESLSESEAIAEAIAKIKQHGYDVFLVLEATIGFSKIEEEDGAAVPARRALPDQDAQFTINAQDLKFLKSLRIAVE
jgi:phosphomevalonate kinase